MYALVCVCVRVLPLQLNVTPILYKLAYTQIADHTHVQPTKRTT